MLPRNVDDGFESDVSADATLLASAGYPLVSYEITTQPALGFRGGLLYPLNPNFEVGASYGFIMGPDTKATVVAFHPTQPGTATQERFISFNRFLAEVRLGQHAPNSWSFDLGAGLGIAAGAVRETCRSTGSVRCLSSENKATWTGATWELSTHFGYTFDRLRFTESIRYAGLPEFSGTQGSSGSLKLSKIQWEAISFVSGVAF